MGCNENFRLNSFLWSILGFLGASEKTTDQVVYHLVLEIPSLIGLRTHSFQDQRPMASNIKGFARKFTCKCACASSVNGPKDTRIVGVFFAKCWFWRNFQGHRDLKLRFCYMYQIHPWIPQLECEIITRDLTAWKAKLNPGPSARDREHNQTWTKVLSVLV